MSLSVSTSSYYFEWHRSLSEFGFTPRCKRDLRSSCMLSSVEFRDSPETSVSTIIFTVSVPLHSEDVQALCRPYYEYIGHVLYCTSNAVISPRHMEHTVSAPRCGTLVIIDSFCCILHSFTLRKVESVSETEGGGGGWGEWAKKGHWDFLYKLVLIRKKKSI